LQEARDNDEISDDAAKALSDRLDNVREHLDEGDDVAKRVRDLTKKIDELLKDEDLDPAVAERLKDILAPLGGN
jgi:hypothetical protein